MEFRKLRADEIEVKVKQINQKGSVFLLYKTARTDMDILDETVGTENWQCAYETIKDNLYCKIGVWSEKLGQWIWKQDCGIESREDNEGNQKKGEASDAFKRAGFKWGIGRELYTSPFIWIGTDVVPTVPNDNGKGYKLKDPFAKFHVSKIGYAENGDINLLEIADSKRNTVYTFGSRTPIKTQPVTGTEQPILSSTAVQDIMNATSVAELKTIYNSYAFKEPINLLKEACAARKNELETN